MLQASSRPDRLTDRPDKLTDRQTDEHFPTVMWINTNLKGYVFLTLTFLTL